VTDAVPPQGPEDDEVSVRRLLAEARADEPMPADVVARMDDVLAGLRSEPASRPEETSDEPAPTEATVTRLRDHRRRRAAGWLLGAAAVVVGGILVAQHLPDDTTSSQNGAASAADGQVAHPPRDSTGSTGSAPKAQSKGSQDGITNSAGGGPVVVRPQHFTADALAARRLQRTPSAQGNDFTSSSSPSSPSCTAPKPYADVVRASYQGAPAILVYRPPAGGAQVVDLVLCGSTRVVRSTTLPHG
jgi:hypothetical protein